MCSPYIYIIYMQWLPLFKLNSKNGHDTNRQMESSADLQVVTHLLAVCNSLDLGWGAKI